MKNSLLFRMMVIVFCTVLLSAVLTLAIFSRVGINAFIGLKTEELTPRIEYLADITSSYLQGRLPLDDYRRMLGSDRNIWDASPYACGSDGAIFVHPNYDDSQKNRDIIEKYIGTVLEGKKVTEDAELLLGYPVYGDNGDIIGAVFLVKALADVHDTLKEVEASLLVSMLGVLGIMIIPVYLASSTLMHPIRKITIQARKYANGDFSQRSDIKGNGEIAVLAQTFNYLASELESNINKLLFERNKLQRIVDGLDEGIVASDSNCNITHCNPAAVRLLGEDCEDRRNLYEQIRALMKSTQKSGEGSEISVPCCEMTLRIKFTPMYEDDAVVGSVVLIQDITEAERYEQARKDYVANVSHELRTPTTSIRSLADALNDGLIKTDEDRARYYGYILRESARLSRLIDDLLELSRLQSGTLITKKDAVDTNELLLEVADRYSEMVNDSEMQLELDLNIQGFAYTNADRVEQVVVILLDNAVKHSECGATIAITADEDELVQRISVKNTGHIPYEHINHLFERFYKVDVSHSGQGTGLGLAIAKEIMDMLGEEISVKNESDNVVFSFTLHKNVK